MFFFFCSTSAMSLLYECINTVVSGKELFINVHVLSTKYIIKSRNFIIQLFLPIDHKTIVVLFQENIHTPPTDNLFCLTPFPPPSPPIILPSFKLLAV